MVTTTTHRRSLLAAAGVTAGLASVLAPSAAHASPAVPPQADQRQPDADPAIGTAATVCASWTDYTTGTGFTVRIPSTTRNGDEHDCTLRLGNQTEGVYKLQDALLRCYDQNIAVDGDYGPATRQAVINVQRFKGIPDDGIYGPQTRAAMTWPKYRDSTGAFDHC